MTWIGLSWEVYDVIDSMIEDIKKTINEKEQDPKETFFEELQKLMVERWNKMTTPLHLLGFALRPRYYSQLVLKENTTRVAPYNNLEVAHKYKAALCRPYHDHIQATMRAELMSFTNTDDCGHEALEDKNNIDAHKWWYFHGEMYQHLQPVANKIYYRLLVHIIYEELEHILLHPLNKMQYTTFEEGGRLGLCAFELEAHNTKKIPAKKGRQSIGMLSQSM